MRTRLLMILSSIVLAIAGLVLTFAPQEFIVFVAGASSVQLTLLAQITGAGYLGFAAMNWMARANLIGGIYSRPVSVGNFMHFLVAAIALVKVAAAGAGGTAIVSAAIVYSVFAIGFGWVAFVHSPGKTMATRPMN